MLVVKFEELIRLSHMELDGNVRNRLRREANTIWRELKLRLLPTDQSGNPSR